MPNPLVVWLGSIAIFLPRAGQGHQNGNRKGSLSRAISSGEEGQ